MTYLYYLWLGQTRVKYIWVPEILIDDLVHKRHTKFNMFPLFDKQIQSICSKQSKYNFCIGLHPKKNSFWPFVDTIIHLRTKPNNFDIQCCSNSERYDQHCFFGTKFRSGQNFCIYDGSFSTRESTLGLTAWTFS